MIEKNLIFVLFFFIFSSFTNIKGIREVKPITAPMNIINLIKSICLNLELKSITRTKAKIEPIIAPPLSKALCIPKAFPFSFGRDSDIRASLGGSRIPLPILSKPINTAKPAALLAKAIPNFEACVKKVLSPQEELTRIEDFNIYSNVFYGNNEFKRWSGYSLGYYIVN